MNLGIMLAGSHAFQNSRRRHVDIADTPLSLRIMLLRLESVPVFASLGEVSGPSSRPRHGRTTYQSRYLIR